MTGAPAKRITYAERAAHYEIEDVDDRDEAFLAGLLTPEVGSVLEVPCGVGRITRHLLRPGRRVVAVDRERQMVERARQRLAPLPGAADLRVEVGDMRDLHLGETFDLIVVQREAFQFLIAREEARRALRSFARHLAPDGRLVIDLSAFRRGEPDERQSEPGYYDPGWPDGEWREEWTRILPQGGTMTRSRRQSHDGGDVVVIEYRYEVRRPDGERESWSTEMRLGIYSKEELVALAASAGLSPRRIYRNYQEQPYRPDAVRTIFVLGHRDAAPAPAIDPPSSSGGDPLVGWIKAAGAGFDNQRDARAVATWAGEPLDAGRRDYFRRYFRTFFHDRFVYGQGTEEILASLERYGAGGRWLDLGAGTTTLFWSIPLAGITSIAAVDIVPEALAELEEVARSGEVPPCYREVLAMFGRPASHLAEMARRLDRFLVFDTLHPWPAWLAAEPYDLVTAFGNFGIAPTAGRYAACFGEVARHLAPGGRAIGADWVRQAAFVAADGHDNSYLAVPLVRSAAAAAGLRVLVCRQVSVSDDPHYRAVLCWAMEKPADTVAAPVSPCPT